MIIRTYKCDECGLIEEKVSIKDNVREYCECGLPLKRVYEPVSVLWHQHNRNRFTPLKIQKEKPILC